MLVAAGLLVLVGFAAAVSSSPFGFFGWASGGEIRSTERPASLASTQDLRDGTDVATISVGQGPSGVAYNSGNGYVYVANYYSNNVSVISGTTVVAPLSTVYDTRVPAGMFC